MSLYVALVSTNIVIVTVGYTALSCPDFGNF